MNLATKDGRWFFWIGVHGFGFRIWLLELQLYVYSPRERTP